MRVLLIAPVNNYAFAYPSFLAFSDFPVGLAYLAAALKAAGHEVAGLNPNNDPHHPSAREMLREKIRVSLEAHRPRLIGMGGLCGDYRCISDAIKVIRELAPGVPVVIGGGIVSHDMEFIFSAMRPDFAVNGEGEEVLTALAAALEKGDGRFDHIPNLGYWKNGEPVFTKTDFGYSDLDLLPFPDYSPFGIEEMLDGFGLANRQLYRYTREHPRVMTIVTARSCPFKCTFCVHQHGPKYRARSVDNVLEEIRLLHGTYWFNVLIILDELFANNKKRFKEFCQSLASAREAYGWDFDWSFQTHASSSLTAEDLALAQAAGCNFFSYGIESTSPKVLASMNKRTKPAQIREAVHLADKAKIGFGGNFIFGDTAESPETFLESAGFFVEHCMDLQVYVGFITPYPGSKLFERCMERGIIPDKRAYYENIDKDYINMTSMPSRSWPTGIDAFRRILNKHKYVMTVEAYHASGEESAPDTFTRNRPGHDVWRISARCPHCRGDIHYREPVYSLRAKATGVFFTTGCTRCHKLVRIHIRGEKRGDAPAGAENGDILGREVSAEKLKRIVRQSYRMLREDASPGGRAGVADAAEAAHEDILRETRGLGQFPARLTVWLGAEKWRYDEVRQCVKYGVVNSFAEMLRLEAFPVSGLYRLQAAYYYFHVKRVRPFIASVKRWRKSLKAR